MQRVQNEHVENLELKKKHRLGRLSLKIFAAILIFGLGLNIGNGSISFSRTAHNTQNSSLPAQLDYSSVDNIYKSLKENYDGKLTESQLLDGLKEGLAQSTHDPYTEYFTPKEADAFKNQLSGTFSGIGAQLGKDSDGNLEVIAPIAGTPADKAGLKAKDIITNINDESTAGVSIDTAVEKIRGKKGTMVTLKIVRNKEQALTFKITRDDISIPSVTTKTLDNNIGYIQISQFGDDTAELTTKAAAQFKAAGVKGIILDLRSNPGGRLDAAVSVSDLWVPTGKTILQEKQGSTVIKNYPASAGGSLEGMPTVVLIDGGSASASEITAGALKDNNAATLIGTKSYGKGVVQQVIPFRDGSELKVTVASWYRPNGQNINKKGILPDTEVKVSDADIAAGNDTQLTAAEQKLANL
ncbi:MAG: S41 family peptidase [Candidatus Saccharimonadales bacterium]